MSDHENYVRNVRRETQRIRDNEHNPAAREQASVNLARIQDQYNRDKNGRRS